MALRDESFGALAYHYDTRRLVFLKSRRLAELVAELGDYETADDALDALVAPDQRRRYESALTRLAASGIISAR